MPPIRRIFEDREELLEYKKFVKPGHFYSPIPSIEEIKENEDRVFGDIPRKILGVELNEDDQLSLFFKFKK